MNRIIKLLVWPAVTLQLYARVLARALRWGRVLSIARTELLRREMLRAGADVRIGRQVSIGKRVTVKASGGSTVRIGDGVVIGDDAFIRVFPGATLILGKGVHVNTHTRVSAYVHIEMGDNSGLAAFSAIHDHHHRYDLKTPWAENIFDGAPVKIGAGVMILARVAVTEGLTIGDHAVVGANSVVTRDLPGGALCAGAPARVLRQLDS